MQRHERIRTALSPLWTGHGGRAHPAWMTRGNCCARHSAAVTAARNSAKGSRSDSGPVTGQHDGDSTDDAGHSRSGAGDSRLSLSDRRDRALREYHDSLVLRVPQRMMAIGGYDRALALSAQAFVALIPMLIVVAALAPVAFQGPYGQALLVGYGISGQAAESVAVLFDHPPAAESLTVVSVALLVITVLGFIRALQRTYLAAWELPKQGIRGLGYGLLASITLVSEFTLLTLLGPALTVFLGSLLIRLTVQALAATVLWWPVQYLLLGGRVGWRALLPGAALTGAGQAGAILVSGLYLPIAISHEAERYGLVGVAIALLSWLVVFGLLLVVSAVLSAELARGPITPGS
jgi:membrane protein